MLSRPLRDFATNRYAIAIGNRIATGRAIAPNLRVTKTDW